MEARQRVLRRLALGDAHVDPELLTPNGRGADARTRALVQLGALLAVDGPAITIMRTASDAMTAGVREDEIVGALASLVPIVGTSRVAAVAPKLGMALGYDIDTAFEER
jgi:alkylhydroperoxidase/carboxymuconolactone decarboxylase family protein YurZ